MDKYQYTDAEMRGILSTALKQQQVETSTFSREQLEETAREFGIRSDQLDEAIAAFHMAEKRREEELKQMKRKRREVLLHVFFFVIFNIGFLISNLFFGKDFPLHWIFIGWSIGLLFHVLQDWFGIDLDGSGKEKEE